MAMPLADLFARDVDASDLGARDPEFIRTVALPFFDALRVLVVAPRRGAPRLRDGARRGARHPAAADLPRQDGRAARLARECREGPPVRRAAPHLPRRRA